jgi:hypothetical protein
MEFPPAEDGEMKHPDSQLDRKAAARRDNSMMTSTESCMVVRETGGRICYRCRKQA